MSKSRPPGPRGHLLLGNTLQFMRDPVSFLRDAHDTYGDAVYLRMFPYRVYAFASPEDVHDVLVKKASCFGKSSFEKQLFGRIMGDGLITTDGSFHRRHRHMIQPAFQMKRLTYLDAMITEHTERMLSGWRVGEVHDMDQEMRRLTLSIVSSALFGIDIAESAGEVAAAIVELEHLGGKEFKRLIVTPTWLPTRDNRRRKHGIQAVHSLIDRLIAESLDRAEHSDTSTVLTALIAARDKQNNPMSRKELRDEVITLFLSGHETTSHMLTWTWYLLSRHVEFDALVHAEAASVLDGRAPGADMVAEMPLVSQALKESLRLYPPVWLMAIRQVKTSTEIAGYPLAKGSMVLICPYIMHRQARYFPRPEQFDPTRFTRENERALPRYAYLPFGGGEHICIGNSFSLLVGSLVLPMVLQRFRCVAESSQEIAPEPLITLGPRGGMPLRIEARPPAPQA